MWFWVSNILYICPIRVQFVCALNINPSLQWMNHLQLRTSVGSWLETHLFPVFFQIPFQISLLPISKKLFLKKILMNFQVSDWTTDRPRLTWQATSIDFICLTFKCCSRGTKVCEKDCVFILTSTLIDHRPNKPFSGIQMTSQPNKRCLKMAIYLCMNWVGLSLPMRKWKD